METSVKKSKEIKIKLTKFYSVEDIALKSTQNYMHNSILSFF